MLLLVCAGISFASLRDQGRRNAKTLRPAKSVVQTTRLAPGMNAIHYFAAGLEVAPTT